MMNQFFIPFKNLNFPNKHRLHMDNVGPHVAVHTRDFLNNNNINHVKSPAQSPDLNPIELVWHDLKVFLGEEVKPYNQRDVKKFFWNAKVTVQYCFKKLSFCLRIKLRICI